VSELRFETFTMPAADLGPENPLPPLGMPSKPRPKEEYSGFSEEDYVAACRLCPTLIPLAIECAQALLDAGRAQDWLDLLSELPDSVRSAGRLKLIEGRAALETGDFDRVERLFAEKLVIVDLREGERSLSHLWFEYHERRLSVHEGIPVDDSLRARVRREFPVPPEIDFRMSADDPVASE
jgi:hypothetical protein